MPIEPELRLTLTLRRGGRLGARDPLRLSAAARLRLARPAVQAAGVLVRGGSW